MLRTIIADGDRLHSEHIAKICSKSDKIKIEGIFEDALSALNYSKVKIPDLVFLEYDFSDMKGNELVERLRDINPEILLIFVTSNYSVSEEMIRLRPDYCLFKPCSEDDISDVIERACALSVRKEKEVFVRTFGRFDVFVNGRIIYFPNKKSKELLALCVDKLGGEVTMEMAIDALWPEKEYDDKVKRLYRKAVSALEKTLDAEISENFFEHSRGSCRICASKIRCDYYDYLNDPKSNKADINTEYMFQYSWAEETAAKLYFAAAEK